MKRILTIWLWTFLRKNKFYLQHSVYRVDITESRIAWISRLCTKPCKINIYASQWRFEAVRWRKSLAQSLSTFRFLSSENRFKINQETGRTPTIYRVQCASFTELADLEKLADLYFAARALYKDPSVNTPYVYSGKDKPWREIARVSQDIPV